MESNLKSHKTIDVNDDKVDTENSVYDRRENFISGLASTHKPKSFDCLTKRDSMTFLTKSKFHYTEYSNLMQNGELKIKECNSKVIVSAPLQYDERQCPICFESEFKHPILLPCSHTFCISCLSDFMRINRYKEFLRCPMCRERIYLSEKGINGFQQNYFVPTKKALCCEICEENIARIVCKDCKKSTCTNCLPSHKCRKSELPQQPNENDPESPLLAANVPVPRSFCRPGRPWTKIVLKEISSVRLNGDKQCLAILPVCNNEAWIISTDGEDITLDLFDWQGTIKQTIPLQSMAYEIAAERSGSMLLTFPNEQVVRRFYGKEFRIIFNSLTFCPLGVAVYQDGSFLVSGFDVDHVAKSGTGKVLYLSESGIMKSYFTTGSNTSPFLIEIVNKDLICLGYPNDHYVEVRFRNGQEVAKYVGYNPHGGFSPVSLAIGCYGQSLCIFISDDHSDSIQIISPEGKFIGLALQIETSGCYVMEPTSIAVDSKSQLWVGNSHENIVSLYEIYEYSNVFE